jgi:hypothetical protein
MQSCLILPPFLHCIANHSSHGTRVLNLPGFRRLALCHFLHVPQLHMLLLVSRPSQLENHIILFST